VPYAVMLQHLPEHALYAAGLYAKNVSQEEGYAGNVQKVEGFKNVFAEK